MLCYACPRDNHDAWMSASRPAYCVYDTDPAKVVSILLCQVDGVLAAWKPLEVERQPPARLFSVAVDRHGRFPRLRAEH